MRRFDNERLQTYPPGAVIVLPGGTPHFHWAMSGDYVTQMSATGSRRPGSTFADYAAGQRAHRRRRRS